MLSDHATAEAERISAGAQQSTALGEGVDIISLPHGVQQ